MNEVHDGIVNVEGIKGVKDGRKPLYPHLIDDHGINPDRVYDVPFNRNLELHILLHISLRKHKGGYRES